MKEIIILYYDDECPFCKNYVKLLKLKEKLEIILKDARTNADEIRLLCEKIDINDGFIVVYNSKCYQGSNALQFLNIAVDKSTFIGKLHFLFKYKNIFSNILYKIFFLSRKIVLIVLNKNTKI